jgi:hypothetical protein
LGAKKKAKQAAKVQGKSPPETADLPPTPTGRTLDQVIDLIEGDEGFDDVVDKDGDSVMSDERREVVWTGSIADFWTVMFELWMSTMAEFGSSVGSQTICSCS